MREYYPSYSWLSSSTYSISTNPQGLVTSGWYKGAPGTQYQQFTCGTSVNQSDWVAIVVTNNTQVSYSAYAQMQRPSADTIYGNIFEILPGQTKYVEIQVPSGLPQNVTLTFGWRWYKTSELLGGSFLGDESCQGIFGTGTSTSYLNLLLVDSSPYFKCNDYMTLRPTNLTFTVDNKNASLSYTVKLQATNSNGVVVYQSSTQSISPMNVATFLIYDFIWLPTSNTTLFFKAVSTEGHGQISNECKLHWSGAVGEVKYSSNINRVRFDGTDISEGGSVQFLKDSVLMDIELINTGNQLGNFRLEIFDQNAVSVLKLSGRDIIQGGSTWWDSNFTVPQFDTKYSIVSYQLIGNQWQSQDTWVFTLGKLKVSTDVTASGFYYSVGTIKTSLEPCGSTTISNLTGVGVNEVTNLTVIPYTITVQLITSSGAILATKDFVVNAGQTNELSLPVSITTISSETTLYVKVLNKTISNAFVDDCNFVYLPPCIINGSDAQGTCCAGTTRCSDGYCRTTCGTTGTCVPDGSSATGTCCTGTLRCPDRYCRTSCGGGTLPPGTCANEGEFSTNTLPCCTGLTKCSDGKCQLTCPCSGFMMGTTCIPSFALVGGGVFFMFIMMMALMK